MVVIRGVNVYPSVVEEIVRGCSEITEYRVEVDSRGPMVELKLEVETTPECLDRTSVPRQLQERFQNALNLRVPVSLMPSGALPRYEMKARRWVRVTEGVA
jgi:phenylacetate-CoA ligase